MEEFGKDWRDAVAIVGLSCRFADCDGADEFWTLLAEGRDGVRPFPGGREDTYAMGDREGVEGGFLKSPVDEFDAKFFGISPREAPFVDPQQRLLLEVIWEALEDAGIPPASLRDTGTGVYLGVWQQDYERHIADPNFTPTEFHHRYLGNAFSATSARISYFLGLPGPTSPSSRAARPPSLRYTSRGTRSAEVMFRSRLPAA